MATTSFTTNATNEYSYYDSNKYVQDEYNDNWTKDLLSGYKYYSDDISDWVDKLKKVEFFRGGKRKDWLKVRKIAEEWKKRAIREGIISSDTKLVRVGKDYTENPSKMFSTTSVFAIRPSPSERLLRHNAYLAEKRIPYPPNLHAYTDMIIGDAVEEKMVGREDYACLEAEILRMGGLLIGVKEKMGLLLFYPSYYKKVMDKLVEDDTSDFETSPWNFTGSGFTTSTAMVGKSNPNITYNSGSGGAVYTRMTNATTI